MKSLYLFIGLVVLSSLTARSQTYDKALADSLGADEYGMKHYTLVILKTGPKTIDSKATVDSLFRGHFGNIVRLAREGKLIVSGPLGKNDKSYRGIFILNTPSTAEARELLATDPALAAGLLEADLFEWYGSAALPVYLKVHDKIQKTRM